MIQTYIELLLLSAIVIYIVDLSGFTDSWKSALAKWLGRSGEIRLKPFDCSLCLTWWTGVIYVLCTHTLSIYTLAYIALLSHLSVTICNFFLFIREGLNSLVRKLFDII